MTDPITDMLNRIRNAQAVGKEAVEAPHSELKYKLAGLLAKQGFIAKVEKRNQGKYKVIKLQLLFEQGRPAITGLRRVSRPGRRVYKKWQDIKRVKDGYGMAVVSTSKGLLTDKEARRKKLGGEVLCEIW